MTLRLSEAFEQYEGEPAVECVARFININYGSNKELMENCRRLEEYSLFVKYVREYISQGYDPEQAVVKAVDRCIKEGILRDVLIKHRAEVCDMFLTTYDKKLHEQALLEEGLEKGREEGRQNIELERQRADQERQRADKAEAELAQLKEELKKLKSN